MENNHNHSHSEVYSQWNKNEFLYKNGQNPKDIKKFWVHVRSNTSGKSNKIKMKLHPFHDYSNALKSIGNESKIASPLKESLTFSNSTTSNKMRQK